MLKNKVTIHTITPSKDYAGDVVESMTYKDFVGQDTLYKENNKIVSEATLKDLDSVRMNYKIY